MNQNIKILHVTNEGIKEIKTDEDFEEIEREAMKHELKERATIIHELKTQNNQATAHPMFCVMEIVNPSLESGEHIIGMKMIREVFFTNKEAERYIEEYGHEHDGELYIYIKSGYRNEGWKLARELMKGDASDN